MNLRTKVYIIKTNKWKTVRKMIEKEIILHINIAKRYKIQELFKTKVRKVI